VLKQVGFPSSPTAVSGGVRGKNPSLFLLFSPHFRIENDPFFPPLRSGSDGDKGGFFFGQKRCARHCPCEPLGRGPRLKTAPEGIEGHFSPFRMKAGGIRGTCLSRKADCWFFFPNDQKKDFSPGPDRDRHTHNCSRTLFPFFFSRWRAPFPAGFTGRFLFFSRVGRGQLGLRLRTFPPTTVRRRRASPSS